MARVRHAVASKRRKKKVFKAAKGYVGSRHKLYRTAKETVRRAKAYSYIHRKLKKREFRALWIARINAACRAHDFKYSEFMAGLKKANIALDRKALAELAVSSKAIFNKLISIAKNEAK